MESCETTAKLVDTTYKNVIEEFGPCIKQLVVAGRTYLKSIYGMVAANKNYSDALSRVANFADNSSLRGSADIGAALHHITDINKEIQAQQSNIMKSLEFDFLEAMEIVADKDIKLISREQKRFLQLHRGRKEAFEKSISTLKKSKRKKSINADKQIQQMKLMESTKTRLEEFCDESLKEAIVQERNMYGTVLERQCAFNKQLLIYYNKASELIQDNIRHWEGLADTRNALPSHCLLSFPENTKEPEFSFFSIEGAYQHMESPAEAKSTYPGSVQIRHRNRHHFDTTVSRKSAMLSNNSEGIYARPMMIRAKSEYSIPSASESTPRLNRIMEYNGCNGNTKKINHVKAMYPFIDHGEYKLQMAEGDIIEFAGPPSVTGWQFGDNTRSKRSGWFPISYTLPVETCDISPPSSRSSGTILPEDEEIFDKIPPPPPPPPTNSRNTQKEASLYCTLRKPGMMKPLPVEPPIPPVYPTAYQRNYHQNDPYQDFSNSHTYSTDSASRHSDRQTETTTVYANTPLQVMHL